MRTPKKGKMWWLRLQRPPCVVIDVAKFKADRRTERCVAYTIPMLMSTDMGTHKQKPLFAYCLDSIGFIVNDRRISRRLRQLFFYSFCDNQRIFGDTMQNSMFWIIFKTLIFVGEVSPYAATPR
ncbi:MAG: hypothetical protein ACOX8U_06250, partial [Bradymonadia bacterium]